MRKTSKYYFSAILLLCALGCNQRLKQQARFSVLDSDTACGETDYRTLEVEFLAAPASGRPAIKLNGSSSDWASLSPTLHDLLLTRMERFVYLRTEPGVSSSDEKEAFHLIENAGAERLCVQDFRAPHKYTPRTIGGTQ